MSQSPDTLETAMAALKRGEASLAAKQFRGLLQANPDDARARMGLAHAHRAAGETDKALEAVERIIARDPKHCGALLLKADLLAEGGDRKGAAPFYLAAVLLAPPLEKQSPSLTKELVRAQKWYREFSAETEEHVRETMAIAGFDCKSSHSRFTHTLDVLFGKRRIYSQQPHQFYYPELPQIQFYERERFAWAPAVEAATLEIREELKGILAEDYESMFRPYLESRTPEAQKVDHDLIGSLDWGACYLMQAGKPVDKIASRCPQTMAVLEPVPLDHIPNRTPTILFSALRPHTHIAPHNGLINTRLICHLPLIVPEGCWFRVGNETRPWKEGELIIFDDTMEHEAMNPTDQLRVVLIFEIWRPELSEEERQFVIELFGAIGDFIRPQ